MVLREGGDDVDFPLRMASAFACPYCPVIELDILHFYLCRSKIDDVDNLSCVEKRGFITLGSPDFHANKAGG